MPAPLPETDAPPLVRTDFTNGRAWVALQEDLDVEWDVVDDYVTFVDEPTYADLPVSGLVALVPAGCPHPVLFVADDVTFSSSSEERAVLVVDLVAEPGRSFRALPETINSIIDNLSSASLSFNDLVNSVDEPTGIYQVVTPPAPPTGSRASAAGRIMGRVPTTGSARQPARRAQQAQPQVRSTPAHRPINGDSTP